MRPPCLGLILSTYAIYKKCISPKQKTTGSYFFNHSVYSIINPEAFML